jgi:valyl-tRNA synthetase
MEKYGTDALRFTMVYLAPLGTDVLYDEENTEIGRNFVTKLWNAGRFLALYQDKYSETDFSEVENENDFIDDWIVSRMNETLKEIRNYLNRYRLNEYTKSIYRFVWSDFCDWYIEMLKIKSNDNPQKACLYVKKAIDLYLDIIKMLHPVIPFVTEELYSFFHKQNDSKIISFSKYPVCHEQKISEKFETDFAEFQEIITAFRNLKAENNISNRQKCKIYIICKDKPAYDSIIRFNRYISEFVNSDSIQIGINIDLDKSKMVSKVLNNFELYLEIEKENITDDIISKYRTEIKNLEVYKNNLEKKLSNNSFIEKAPEVVVEKEKQKLQDTISKIEKLKILLNK